MNKLSLQVGFELPIVALPPVTAEQLKEYAHASGDFNAIHLDESVAKQMGLPGIIAHGMYMASLLTEYARNFAKKTQGFPASWEMNELRTRFRAMTLLGDIPTCHGSVKEISDTHLVIDLQMKNQRGETTLTGQAHYGITSALS